jgi:hypothetical protein
MKSLALLALLNLAGAATPPPEHKDTAQPPSAATATEKANVAVAAASLMPPNVQLIEAVMEKRALHSWEAAGLRLPRITVFVEGTGHVLHAIGWDNRVPGRFDKALSRARAVDRLALGDLLKRINDSAGQPLAAPPLQPGDVIVLTYWAKWCLPCGTALAELTKLMGAASGRRFVWITVEADPVAQQILRQTIR